MPTKTNNKCAYKNCNNVPSKRPDLSFHRIPIDERTQDWILRSGNDSLTTLSIGTLHGKRLCSEHFTADQYVTNSRATGVKRRLLYSAMPISFSPLDVKPFLSNTVTYSVKPKRETSPPENVTIKTENDLTETIINDHSYYSILDSDGISATIISKNGTQAGSDILTVNNVLPSSNFSYSTEILKRKILILKQKLRSTRKEIIKLRRRRPPRVTLDTVIENCSKFMSSNQLTLLRMQLDNRDIREWLPSERRMIIPLYKISPQAYEFLREELGIKLPSIATVRRWTKS